jgi:hypothetical protein
MRVIDRSSTFLTGTGLGKLSYTPEKFLVAHDVRIGRTGEMLYGPGEVYDADEKPIAPGADGVIRVSRSPDEVFRPETLRSFEGKDVVDDHPDEEVTPENWRQYAVGHIQNVRKGEGVDEGFQVADLVIKDAGAIAAVKAGKVEVSCGYDAEYEQTGPGRARQKNIIGNHLALVHAGRCGSECAIKDHHHRQHDKETPMPKRTIGDALRKLLKAKDQEELMDKLGEELPMEHDEEGSPGHRIEVHNYMPGSSGKPKEDAEEEPDPAAAKGEGKEKGEGEGEFVPAAAFAEHVAQNNERFDKLEAMIAALGAEEVEEAGEGEEEGKGEMDAETAKEVEEEVPPEKKKDAKKTKDSALLADSFQATAAAAEILAPGIAIPTYDRAAKPKATFDAICSLRRAALQTASQDPVIGVVVRDTGDPATMSCGAVRALFKAASSAKRMVNDSAGPLLGVVEGTGGKAKVPTAAEINARNTEFYARKSAAR